MKTKKAVKKKATGDKQETRRKLIDRVTAARRVLPGSGITTLFILKFPEYAKDAKAKSRLNNVLQYRTADETITGQLEELAKSMKKL